MKQLLYSLILLSFFACSKSSEEEPAYIKFDTPLYPYFCDTETKSSADVILGTVKKGNEYQIKLYPCCNGVNSEYIKGVTYYLNDIEIEVTNKGAFSATYIIKEEPGIYTLTCKPLFSSEYVIWEVSEGQKVTVL